MTMGWAGATMAHCRLYTIICVVWEIMPFRLTYGFVFWVSVESFILVIAAIVDIYCAVSIYCVHQWLLAVHLTPVYFPALVVCYGTRPWVIDSRTCTIRLDRLRSNDCLINRSNWLRVLDVPWLLYSRRADKFGFCLWFWIVNRMSFHYFFLCV